MLAYAASIDLSFIIYEHFHIIVLYLLLITL